MDRPSALAQLRAAVEAFTRTYLVTEDPWCVALSGGPDSLALTAVAAQLRPTTAVIVDHGLQPDSAAVAETARSQALALGCVAAQVVCVQVDTSSGGPEAAARAARYAALNAWRGGPVLLAHTLDDQAETVLLGLGRGSGARSIAGMRPYDPPWCRPLLGVRRSVTHAACQELALTAWQDPHNTDRRFTRGELRCLLETAGLAPARITYWNSVLFPAAAGVRLLRRFTRPEGSDLAAGSGASAGALFAAAFALERAILRRAPLPFGVSVFAVAGKPAEGTATA